MIVAILYLLNMYIVLNSAINRQMLGPVLKMLLWKLSRLHINNQRDLDRFAIS